MKILMLGTVENDEFSGSINIYHKLHIILKRYFNRVSMVETMSFVMELQLVLLTDMNFRSCRILRKESVNAAAHAENIILPPSSKKSDLFYPILDATSSPNYVRSLQTEALEMSTRLRDALLKAGREAFGVDEPFIDYIYKNV